MKKRITLKEHMTGKELAKLLHRSHLRWNNGAVIERLSSGRHSYCMIEQIARLAGVSNQTLDRRISNAPYIIPATNDKCSTKAECVQAFCDLGDMKIPVKEWVEEMLQKQRERNEEETEQYPKS
jgi:hypothetical protein